MDTLNIETPVATTQGDAKFAITIHRNELFKVVNYVQAIVERKVANPSLGNLLLVATEDQHLQVTATDLDIMSNASTVANVEQAGSLTVPAVTLYDILRKLPESEQVSLKFDASTNQLLLKTSNASFKLPVLPAHEFPSFNQTDFTHHYTASTAQLRDLIDQIRFAMSTEETRYYLNGIYLHPVEKDTNGEEEAEPTKMLAAVATDLHRLAYSIAPELTIPQDLPGVIVPRKTVNEIRRLLEGLDTEIQLSVSTQKIRFTCTEFTLVSKLIDGIFPDYQAVIPANNDKVAVIDRKQFIKAIELVTIVTEEKTSGIKLKLNHNHLTISASNSHNFAGQEVLTINYEGPELELGFNPRYLLDVAQVINHDDVQLFLSSPSAPIIVKDMAQPEQLYLVMPMRVV